MSNLIIREAQLADMPTLLKHEQDIIDFERSFNKDIKKENAKYYNLKSLITGSDSVVFVGEIDNEIIATGYALIKEGLAQFTYNKFTYLGFMYVSPAHRGKGVNAKIIEAAMDWSKTREVDLLRLEVYSENESAIKAYKKLGFETELQEMKLWIE